MRVAVIQRSGRSLVAGLLCVLAASSAANASAGWKAATSKGGPERTAGLQGATDELLYGQVTPRTWDRTPVQNPAQPMQTSSAQAPLSLVPVDAEDATDYVSNETAESRFDAFLSYEGSVEWAGDRAFEEDPEATGSGYGFFKGSITENLGVEAELSWSSGANEEFWASDSQQLYADSIYATFGYDEWWVEVGKLNPLYNSWDIGSGWYTGLQSDDLSVWGVLGVLVERQLASEKKTTVSAGLFYRDTSKLSGSIITDGDDTELFEGGVGNTGEMNNSFVAISGEDPFFGSVWDYSLGVVYQSAGATEENREISVYSTLYGYYTVGESTQFNPFFEVVHRDGAGGEEQNATTLALGMLFEQATWYAGGSFSIRRAQNRLDYSLDDPDLTPDGLYPNRDLSFELFAGYVHDSGAYLDFGYQYLEEFGEPANFVTLAIGFAFSFGGSEMSHDDMRRMTR